MPFPIHPGDALEFDLVPAGEDRFNAGLYRDGKLFNVEMGAALEFDFSGERASAVRLRGIEGTVFMEGKRSAGAEGNRRAALSRRGRATPGAPARPAPGPP